MDLSEVKENGYRHPWELARTDCILKELKALGVKGNILDIGCGDQYFDHALAERCGGITGIYGLDIYGKESCSGKVRCFNSYEKLPALKYDFILMMDVLEHIEDDAGFLRSLEKYTGPDTTVLITVPAYQKLFSAHDVSLHHFRRYERKSLEKVIDAAGSYRTIRNSYFFFTLVPLRLLTRNDKNQDIGGWKYPEGHIFTSLIRGILKADYSIAVSLSKIRIFVPGLSLLKVIRPVISQTGTPVCRRSAEETQDLR